MIVESIFVIISPAVQQVSEKELLQLEVDRWFQSPIRGFGPHSWSEGKG